MATEINDSENCKAVLASVLKAIEGEALSGASPMDIAHALTFILCIYKFKFGWSTEQVLSLYELYILKMEEALECCFSNRRGLEEAASFEYNGGEFFILQYSDVVAYPYKVSNPWFSVSGSP